MLPSTTPVVLPAPTLTHSRARVQYYKEIKYKKIAVIL